MFVMLVKPLAPFYHPSKTMFVDEFLELGLKVSDVGLETFDCVDENGCFRE